MGYRTVTLSSSESNEKFAKELKAIDYIDGSKENHAEALQKIEGAAWIVVTASNPSIIGELLEGLTPQGKLLILAHELMMIVKNTHWWRLLATCDVNVNTIPIITKDLSVHEWWPSGHSLDCEKAVKFVQLHDIHCMIEKFPLSEAHKAYDHTTSGNVRFRSVITMN